MANSLGKIKVAVLPLDIVWANRQANFDEVEKRLAEMDRDTDIVVLPELFSTGYIQDESLMADIAESSDGETMKFVRRMVREHSCAIAGSFFARENDVYCNRGFFVEPPDGDAVFYDKRHLFSLSMESKLYGQGKRRPPVVRFRGWNISLIVCYDLRFPVWCRNDRQRYDMMLVPANWPVARKYAWDHLLMARAIENQAVYVGADRSGKDDFGCYDDMALIADAMGKPIHSVAPSGFVYAVFDKAELEKIRRKLPFGNDADDYCIPDCH